MRKYVLFILCSLVACTVTTKATDNDVIAAAYRLQAFAIYPFEEPLGDYSEKQNARTLIVVRFGEPPSSSASKRQDRTSSAMLSEYVYDYEGLRFRIVENETGNRSALLVTEVTGNEHPLKFGLGIGATREEVVAALGEVGRPTSGGGTTFSTNIVQDPPGQSEWHGGTIEVYVYFDSERVSKILIMPSGP